MIGFLLSSVAILLFVIIAPFGFLWQVITNLKGVNKYLFKVAVSIDQMGNVVCNKLFNDVMIKGNLHKFGNPDETISSVIGKNHKSGTLTFFGHSLHYLLNKIEKNHSENAIEEDENERKINE